MHDKMEPGIYENISFSDYMEIDALNSSYIHRFLKNPAKAQVKTKTTKEMEFGTAMHYFLLQPDIFHERVAIVPGTATIRRNTKKWKELVGDSFLGLKKAEYDAMVAMRESFDNPIHSFAKKIISAPGQRELTIVWDDTDFDVLCKARIDILSGLIVTDYKTTRSAEPHAWERSVECYGYDIQAAFYKDGIDQLNGKNHQFLWVAQEKEAPYLIQTYKARESRILEGREKYKQGIADILEAKETGVFRGYRNGITEI